MKLLIFFDSQDDAGLVLDRTTMERSDQQGVLSILYRSIWLVEVVVLSVIKMLNEDAWEGKCRERIPTLFIDFKRLFK